MFDFSTMQNGCLKRVKDTNFKANHNPDWYLPILVTVV